jgi:hypothetical protein
MILSFLPSCYKVGEGPTLLDPLGNSNFGLPGTPFFFSILESVALRMASLQHSYIGHEQGVLVGR